MVLSIQEIKSGKVQGKEDERYIQPEIPERKRGLRCCFLFLACVFVCVLYLVLKPCLIAITLLTILNESGSNYL